MRIKRSDMELMMRYIEKEKPETISILPDNFKINFTFTDSENRNCTVTLFESTANTTPELTKNMKLYTRMKDSKPQEDTDE